MKENIKRRRKRNARRKQLLPFFVAGGLIALVLVVVLGVKLIQKYSPSKEHMALTEYYSMTEDSQVAITLNHTVLDEFGTLIDGHVYLDYEFVHDVLNSRFYWDENENILLYTTASDVISANADATSYMIGKSSADYGRVIVKATADSAWVDIDFVNQYSDFTYTYYDSPSRIVITNEWTEITTSTLKGNTEVRYKGGIKSPILADVKKGDELTILAVDEKWTKVCTIDGITGYVKSNKVKKTETKQLVSEYTKETFNHIKKEETINLIWHPVYSTAGNDTISTILSETKGINVISPSWFKLRDNEGNISSYASSSYVDYCHSHGVEVWAMVKNLDLDSENIDITYILTHTSARQNLVNQIISQALQYNLDGINIDFEELNGDAIGDGYIQFLRELSIKCENNDIILSTDVLIPESYNEVYKYGEQVDFVDYVIVMTYDQHTGQRTGEGSVAALNWVEECLNNTLGEGVPADQLVMTAPFYTRLWKLTPSIEDSLENQPYKITRQHLSLDAGKRWMQNNVSEPIWLEDCNQWYGEIQKGSTIYKLWLEDETSIEGRLQLMQEYNLAGIAFWSTDWYNTSIWDVIIKYMN